ncbi:MAG: nucleoside 2-deoxyribosyltransferase [Thiobacillaceae bacterium]|jgi:nucleoside 2-deoxyribosyltransferase|nr:nucleoside 2-deoxyribosyltransferase [Thiobacillaceae bacterium]
MGTKPKPFVFVLMPFSAAFDDAYAVAIQPACEAVGAYAERVDKQIFAGSIMDRVYNQISKADIIVADMSERNPNVFYEVGYAHAIGKTTILLTRSETDIPFDLRQYPHIVYGTSLTTLKTELQRRVAWHIQNPTQSDTSPEELEIRVNGQSLPTSQEIVVETRGESGSITVVVAIQNKAERNIRTLSFRAVFSSPLSIEKATDRRKVEFDFVAVDDSRLFTIPSPFQLLPSQWTSIDLILQRKHEPIREGEVFACALHLYFESGALSVPFSLRAQNPKARLAGEA